MKKIGIIAALGLVGLYLWKKYKTTEKTTENTDDNTSLDKYVNQVKDNSMPDGISFRSSIELKYNDLTVVFAKANPDKIFSLKARVICAFCVGSQARQDITLYSFKANGYIFNKGIIMPPYVVTYTDGLELKAGWYQHIWDWGTVELTGKQILEIFDYIEKRENDDPVKWAHTDVEWMYGIEDGDDRYKGVIKDTMKSRVRYGK